MYLGLACVANDEKIDSFIIAAWEIGIILDWCSPNLNSVFCV